MNRNRKQPNVAVIGCPENRRVSLFQAALRRFGLGEATVISWLEVLRAGCLPERAINPDTLLRIDSAGENFAVERELIALGAPLNGGGKATSISPDRARQLEFDRGRILYPHQWF